MVALQSSVSVLICVVTAFDRGSVMKCEFSYSLVDLVVGKQMSSPPILGGRNNIFLSLSLMSARPVRAGKNLCFIVSIRGRKASSMFLVVLKRCHHLFTNL